MSLQRVLVFKSQLFYLLLTQRTFFPTRLRHFVAADVKKSAVKYLAKFVYNIFGKVIHVVFSAAAYIVRNSPFVIYLRGFACARKIWIAGNSRYHMSGHIYLRYHLDESFLGVCNDLAHIVLRII